MFLFSFSIITLIVMFSDQCMAHNCKRNGDSTCYNNTECCSDYCYKDPSWSSGQCREHGNPITSNQISQCSFENIFESKGFSIFYTHHSVAIHKTLPINTKVRVFLKNGKTLVVNIIDNGPFGKTQTLRLSKNAAWTLGVDASAKVPCEVTILNQIGCLKDMDECTSYKECCSQSCRKIGDFGLCEPLSIQSVAEYLKEHIF